MTNENYDTNTVLRDLEKLGVYEWFHYDGYSIWPAMKLYISIKETDFPSKRLDADNKLTFLIKSITIFVISLLNFLISVFFKRKRNTCFSSFAGLTKVADKSVDVLIPNSDKRAVQILNCSNTDQYFSNLDYVLKNSCIVDNFFFGTLSRFLHPLLRRRVRTGVLASKYNRKRLVEHLSTSGIKVSDNEIVNVITQYISAYVVYKFSVQMLCPTKATIISSYTKSPQCAALLRRSLKLTEIQHGVIGTQVPGYNYSHILDKPAVKLPVPYNILVYNDFWKQELLAAGFFTDDQISVVGNQKIDILMEESHNPYYIKSYIIFTGQFRYLNEVAVFLKQVCDELLAVDSTLIVMYRPHPKETKQQYGVIEEILGGYNNFLIVNDREISTERLIRDSLQHISYDSACHFDALHLLGQTYFIDFGKSSYMDYFVNRYGRKYFKKIVSVELFVSSVLQD